MTKGIEWTKEQEKEWDEWVASRPQIIQDLCKKIPSYKLYLLKNSGHRVTIYSYSEDGTMTVNVTGKYNKVIIDRQVFGIKPDDLEECDFPNLKEEIGTLLTKEEDIKTFIDFKRRLILAKRKNQN